MNYGHCEMADGEEVNPRDTGTDEPLPLISGLEPQRIYGGKTVGQNKNNLSASQKIGDFLPRLPCVTVFAHLLMCTIKSRL